MTLQEILRAKDTCNGCKHQDRHFHGEHCVLCISRAIMWKSKQYTDNYELDETLKEVARLATVGRYTEQRFKEGAVFLIGSDDEVDTIKEFIEWGEEQERDKDGR